MTTACPYAKSDMTPCVIKDGPMCWAVGDGDRPICVGCERGPKTLGVPFPADWEQTLEQVRREATERRRR
jgi:hypothetical protein